MRDGRKTREITALAVGSGHLVPHDTEVVERRVETSRGMLGYEFPVAGLASWLCLKADAIMRRDKPKDAYDVVWLISAIGPVEAARRIAGSPLPAGDLAGEVLNQLSRLVDDQFRDLDAAGPAMYVSFLGMNESDADRRHAHGTLAARRRALDARGIRLAGAVKRERAAFVVKGPLNQGTRATLCAR